MVEYKSSVFHDLKHIDKRLAKKILKELEDALSNDLLCGEALSGQFNGLLKLRMGDYRVVYSKTKEGVIILRIRHRSKAYR
ncbi:MAG: type II toxin-antitoxin system RelE/ParE family toxin [Methanotrichaceae archaeon]|nr:type II toxin-antitoxin system RelE/ParE family toxin [Methanotrichaceae archaeon]